MVTGLLNLGRAAGVLLISSILVACGGGGGSPPPPPANVALAISPTNVVLDPGLSHTFSATGGEAPYSFDVASGAGSIDAGSGVYTAGPAAGNTTVRVSDHGGHTATAAVTVNDVLRLTPSPATVAVGATLKLTPTGGTAPYTLALDSGNGSFDPTTHIYTASTATGTATVSVTDTLGSKATVTVFINPGLAAVAPSFTLTASSGQTYQIPVSGGTTPLVYSVTSGTGTVDTNGVYTAGTKVGYDEVQVTDAHGVTSSVRIRLLEALTNGQILSLISDSSGIYAGGIFSTVHPHVTSRMAALDATSGKLSLRCDVSTGFDAPTTVLLVVGNSLYVGGSFTHYQGHPAHALVKLDAATCAMDPQFTQATGFDGFVSPVIVGNPNLPNVVSLATDGTSLFVGGDFSSYRGQPAFGLAKLDLTTGTLDQTFTQAIGFDNAVDLIAASRDALYLYGRYSHYRGTDTTNSFPLKLNTLTGNIDPTFNAPWGGGFINSMAVSGTSIYIGGSFPARLSKLDATTGAADQTFQNNLSNIPQEVFALAPAGASLYLGGLSNQSGALVGHLAKIDANTGKPDTTFNRADTTANPGVWSLATGGDSVYMAGVSQFGDQNLPGRVAKLDATTGTLDTSFGDGASFYGGTPTAILASGDTLYLGGTMVNYGGIAAQNVAKFEPATGVADSTFLSAGGAERAVTKIISNGSSLYVAGGFSTFGGVHAPSLAKVDPMTGKADSQFSRGSGFEGELNQDPGVQGSVRTMALSGNSLFVGGVFQYYRGLPLVALAKVDALTGDVDTTFNQAGSGFTGTPGSGVYGTATIQSMALSGSSLYVSGTYTAYRGTPTFILSKLDSTSGALDSHFVTYNGMVFVLPFSETEFNVIVPVGNSLYVGGGTLPVPGGPNTAVLSGVGKFDATTGAPDMTFINAAYVAPNGSSTPLVFDLFLSGTSLYVGGDFTAYNSKNFAKIDIGSGVLDTTFSQAPGANYRVYSIIQSGNLLRISGAFTTYGSGFAGYSTLVDPNSGNPISP